MLHPYEAGSLRQNKGSGLSAAPFSSGRQSLLELGDDALRVLVEDRLLVILSQERELADDRHHVVRSLAGLGSDGAAGARGLGAEADVVHTVLLDVALEVVDVV